MQTAPGLTRIELLAPATNETSMVVWVEETFDSTDDITITAVFTLGINTGSSPYTVRVAATYGNTAGTSASFVGQYQEKTTLAYERFTLTALLPAGSFSAGTHTRRFGLGVDIFGDGVNDVQADFLDVTVTVQFNQL